MAAVEESQSSRDMAELKQEDISVALPAEFDIKEPDKRSTGQHQGPPYEPERQVLDARRDPGHGRGDERHGTSLRRRGAVLWRPKDERSELPEGK